MEPDDHIEGRFHSTQKLAPASGPRVHSYRPNMHAYCYNCAVTGK